MKDIMNNLVIEAKIQHWIPPLKKFTTLKIKSTVHQLNG